MPAPDPSGSFQIPTEWVYGLAVTAGGVIAWLARALFKRLENAEEKVGRYEEHVLDLTKEVGKREGRHETLDELKDVASLAKRALEELAK